MTTVTPKVQQQIALGAALEDLHILALATAAQVLPPYSDLRARVESRLVKALDAR